MPLYDYECDACRIFFEVHLPLARLNERVSCGCGKVAHRVLLRAPAYNGGNKGYPRFDVQLGCTLESASHMEQVAKSRGLVPMGNEEWKRSLNAPGTPDPLDSREPDPALIEIAKKAWDDVKFGRIAPEVIEDRVADVIKDCDVLDANVKPVAS